MENPGGTNWIARFAVFGVAAVAVIVAAAWAALRAFGLDTAGTVAAVLGVLFTALVGFGLMGLVFYSDRSGQDEAAAGQQVEPRE